MSPLYQKEIDSCGEEVDRIDERIAELLARRQEFALDIERIKRENSVPIIRRAVEKARMFKYRGLAKKFALSSFFLQSIFWLIIGESVRVQLAQREKEGNKQQACSQMKKETS